MASFVDFLWEVTYTGPANKHRYGVSTNYSEHFLFTVGRVLNALYFCVILFYFCSIYIINSALNVRKCVL